MKPTNQLRAVRRWPIRVGRVTAAISVATALGGLATLVAIGHLDHIVKDYVLHSAVPTVGLGTVAWLAISRQPTNRAVWIIALAALLTGISTAGWATAIVIGDMAGLDVSSSPQGWYALTPAMVPPTAAVAWMVVFLGVLNGIFLLLTLGLLLFPEGRLPSPGWRWVAWLAVPSMLGFSGLGASQWRPGSDLPYGAGSAAFTGISRFVDTLLPALVGLAVISLVSLVVGYRHSSGSTRQQYRWIGWGCTVMVASLAAALLTQNAIPSLEEDGGWQRWAILLGMVAMIGCYGVAITRYRLYDIDVVVSRTFVYGILAAFIGGVYVLVVVVLGGALGSGTDSLPLAIAATALVAVAFEPLRRRAQRWANRLVYGKRATPYEVLSGLTRRLARTEPAEGMLERITELMAEGTGADQATVWLTGHGRLTAAAGWPRLPEPGTVMSIERLAGLSAPVMHDGELVGALEVIKSRGNPITPAEQRLISDLAGSAGLVLGNQRLNAALAARAAEIRASRRRLVEIQDDERRRLERDLHDGAQQQVVAIKVKIGLAEHIARRADAEQLPELLSDLAAETQAVVDEIRTLAKGIYPILLESDSLAAAIANQAGSLDLPAEVVGESLTRHPREVESALYFAARETLELAAGGRKASRLRITLGQSATELQMEMILEGGILNEGGTVGLDGARDRVEAVGGRIEVTPGPEGATLIRVGIPLDEAQLTSAPEEAMAPSP